MKKKQKPLELEPGDWVHCQAPFWRDIVRLSATFQDRFSIPLLSDFPTNLIIL